jgi:hypothetical protein
VETPAEGLARLERMGQRARARRAAVEAEERRQQEVEDRTRRERERQEAVNRFLAGPPNGCTVCYMFGQRYNGAGQFPWEWWHVTNVNPELRPWPDDDDPEPVEYCTCRCHGPEGYPLLTIALA